MTVLTIDSSAPVENLLKPTIITDSLISMDTGATYTSNIVQLLVVASEYWSGSQAYLNQTLANINLYTPINLIVTMDDSFAATWARVWATSQGITWFNAYNALQAYGVNPFGAPLTLMDNINSVLTCGTHARVSTVATIAQSLNKTVVQI